jgi:deoxyribonuclease V
MRSQELTHDWDVSAAEAGEIQEKLRKKVRIADGFRKVNLVAGADVHFKNGTGCAACLVMTFPQLEIVEEVMVKGSIRFPYVPGLLTFREGPLLLLALSRLQETPDVMIFDGQGIAHPRGLGLAAHMGVLLGRPTIGCAKSRLVGEYAEPALRRGSVSALAYQGREVGSVVRTRTNVKPVFVSPGHMVGLASSARLVLECATKYRIPEPTRIADHRCRREIGSG